MGFLVSAIDSASGFRQSVLDEFVVGVLEPLSIENFDEA